MAAMLDAQEIVMHNFVVGGIALGILPRRETVLSELRKLRFVSAVRDQEAWRYLESQRLWGLGIGYVDLHLLASAQMNGVLLWTRDARLLRAAQRLGIAFDEADISKLLN